MAILNNSNAISSGGYTVNNSLRFRSSASAYLNRTLASAGNRKTWTWSGWVKRGTLGSSVSLFDAYTSSNSYGGIFFDSNNCLNFQDRVSSVNTALLTTTQVFRDPSAWYHIVVQFDTPQATSTNRIKIYVNGSQITSFSTASYPTQNLDGFINNNILHEVGSLTGSLFFDGYLAEVNFIDGQALTPSSFGETDTTTGVWKPKQYTGTYGTNGFYLKFSDIATTSGSNAGLGKDFSGNTNYWTTNNISVTSGTTYDAMIDSPTNASSGTQPVGNYAVMNPLQKSTGVTVSDANLGLTTGSGSPPAKILSTIGMSSGKWYCEITMMSGSSNGNYGLATASTSLGGTTYLGDDAYSWCYAVNGNKYTSGSGVAYGATYTVGDVIGVAFDADAGTLIYYKNGVSQGTAYSGLTSGPYFFAQGAASSIAAVNFGQRPFAYSVPSGYKALCTTNLPDSTIVQGNKYMDATLYTGTGAARSVTNSGGFQPDFVWIKGRGAVSNHALIDSVRGVSLQLSTSDIASGQLTAATGVTSFNSNGWSLGSGSTGWSTNDNTATYVGWQWKAGGSAVTNTAGSITSQVSANTTAGFSVVTFTTGASGTATIGHGLGVAPKMIFVKGRGPSTSNWLTYHASATDTVNKYLLLNTTDAVSTSPNIWGAALPTSTVFGITNGTTTVASQPAVAYCFAEVPGFSKFGSYVGNYSTDGVFIYTGFRPKFILIKAAYNAYDWELIDTARSSYNSSSNYLQPNLSSAEYSTTSDNIDILSNGFKMRNNWTRLNDTITYIYAAFAESPFKVSLAR